MQEVREAVTLINHQQKIFAILHLPVNASSVPVVLICSGYGGQKSGKFRLFVKLSQELAKRGIASLRFDYRGAGDSEGEFEEMTLESQVQDTHCCLEFLKSHPAIDPHRIGLCGRSLGGMIAILAMPRYPCVTSLVLWAPVFTSQPWKRLWQTLQAEKKLSQAHHNLMHHLPPIFPNKNFIEQFFQSDMTTELQRLQHIPLLHIQGEIDQIVTQEHALAFQQARQNNLHTRFVSLPHSDHDFSHLEDQRLAIQETCQWYQQTL